MMPVRAPRFPTPGRSTGSVSDTRQTAIAIAAGATQAEAINRRENETIDWRDYDVTSTTWLAWKWYN